LSDAAWVSPDSAIVVGRIVLDRPASLTRLSVVVLRLEGDEAVAIQTVWLDADGRFRWVLDSGTYAVPLARLHSAYRGGAYHEEQTMGVNMRFEAVANRPHYLGTLAVERSTDGTTVRRTSVRNDLDLERASDPNLNRQGGRLEAALLQQDPGLPSYRVRPATGCSKWSNVCWLVMYGDGCLNARH
jgi:hypothetical protein